MFIRLKIGCYAGEIRDVENEAARKLLARGEAEDPYAPAATNQPRPNNEKRSKGRRLNGSR